MRHIALLGLALCLVSLLLSAEAADGSVGGLLDRGIRFVTDMNGPASGSAEENATPRFE